MNKKIKSIYISNATLVFHRTVQIIGSISWKTVTLFSVGLIFAIALRLSLIDYKTLDFYASLKPWYNTIFAEGFSAFGTNFSTYNPPYLYLLYVIARLFPNLPTVLVVKLPSLVADFICGYFIYRIVQIKYKDSLIPYVAGMTILFAPTVVLNSAFWGQADSLFTAGILACIFFLLVNRNIWAFICFGIAMAFKLQAIFLAPVLIVLFLRKTVSWKCFLIIPAMLILALVPAWFAGRPVLDLMNIYLYQTSQFQLLTMNAASIYSWLPTTNQVFNLFYLPGVFAGAIVAFMLIFLAYKSPNELSKAIILEFGLLTTIVIPFFLPKMHERYFYPADIISIAFAFYYPQFFYIPFLVGGVSFFSYQSFLFNSMPIPLPILTLVLLLAISILTYHFLCQIYSLNSLNLNSKNENNQKN